MHQIYLFFFFFLCLTVLLIHLLLEEMHAATLHGTTRRNNDIQVLKDVCRVTVCTTGPGLQGHPIGFSNHFHLFGFNVQVLLSHFLFYFCYWRRGMRQRCTGPLVYTIKSGVLFCFVLFVCLFVMRVMRFATAGWNGACGVSTESPRQGGVRNAGFVAFGAPGAEIQNFKVFTSWKIAGKWEKWPKLGKFQKNHSIPTPQKFCC